MLLKTQCHSCKNPTPELMTSFNARQLRRSTERADDGTQETSESDSCESASFESDDEDAATDDNRDGLATAETRKKKLKKRRHKVKKSPSKLAYSKLKFDVLERQRLDKERLLIHVSLFIHCFHAAAPW